MLKLCILLDYARGSTLEVVNGALLYISYVVTRLVSLPCWLALYAHDIYTQPGLTWGMLSARGAASTSASTVAAHKFMCVSFPLCTVAVWVLSCVWFLQIHRGFVKALRGRDPLEGEGERVEKMLGNRGEGETKQKRT